MPQSPTQFSVSIFRKLLRFFWCKGSRVYLDMEGVSGYVGLIEDYRGVLLSGKAISRKWVG